MKSRICGFAHIIRDSFKKNHVTFYNTLCFKSFTKQRHKFSINKGVTAPSVKKKENLQVCFLTRLTRTHTNTHTLEYLDLRTFRVDSKFKAKTCFHYNNALFALSLFLFLGNLNLLEAVYPAYLRTLLICCNLC